MRLGGLQSAVKSSLCDSKYLREGSRMAESADAVAFFRSMGCSLPATYESRSSAYVANSTSPPNLAGLDVAEIDYVPEIGMRTITPAGGRPRDMQDQEVDAADALLKALTM